MIRAVVDGESVGMSNTMIYPLATSVGASRSSHSIVKVHSHFTWMSHDHLRYSSAVKRVWADGPGLKRSPATVGLNPTVLCFPPAG